MGLKPWSSSTKANPGWSPRGETSALPAALAVDKVRNGARSMKALQYLSRNGSALRAARSEGEPSAARNCSAEVKRTGEDSAVMEGTLDWSEMRGL